MFNFMSDLSSLNRVSSLDLDRSMPRLTLLANNHYFLIVPD